MATLAEVTDRIRQATASDAGASGAGLAESIKLDLKGEGVILIAGGHVSNDDAPADLVVTVSLRDLTALGKGELDATRAMMSGRLKLSNLTLAMKLQPRIKALFARTG